ncbi:sulfotransferase family 2 domain-containing protein [Gilvibacter sp.]|uniref:sulfotransferase family 2 domain-containing protein n=1 Tax=Gilvibacter sp. TaxID=2729997 RepID=UPI003B51DF26
MVSHKHRCIFIHISKCAGTTVEEAFGVDTTGDAQMGYGWNPDLGIHMQHATPDELLTSGLVTKAQWETYYKFIIVRNPYARAYSDYAWVMLNGDVWGPFGDFIGAKGAFKKRLNVRSVDYMGEHLRSQSEYFLLAGAPVAYDQVIRLESAKAGFATLCEALNLPEDFFKSSANVNKKKLPHYSWFYNANRRRLVADKYQEDLKSLNYSFDDQRPTKLNWLNDLILIFGRSGKLNFRLKYPFLAHRWGRFKRSLLGT